VINATVVFVIFGALFVIAGAMRGWKRELIASAAIVLGLFALQALNGVERLTSFASAALTFGLDFDRQLSAADRVKLSRFALLTLPFLLLVFFGYLGPTMTSAFAAGKAIGRGRAGFRDGVLGMLVGAANAWMVLSTVARFAFNQGLLPDQGQFPSTGPALFLPPPGGWSNFLFVEASAFVILAGVPLIVALVVLFLFVIIAFI
jgi:hypothetical protein